MLRQELHPKGLEIVTVALDSRGAAAARPFIEAAKPEHPSLLDLAHVLDALLGIVNVPSGLWIDEDGLVVRPPEPAFPTRAVEESIASASLPDVAPPRSREALALAKRIRFEPERYVAALRDWVMNGASSRFALTSDEVARRSRRRTPRLAMAAARFELGQHLARTGHADDAIAHLREALRLAPDNWTYRRQAHGFLDAGRDPRDVYGSDWLDEASRIGAESYYPPLEL